MVLYYPIKKWAAGAAIFFTSGYLFISGLTIPAQRAFVMTCIVLTGVIVDRTVLTLRNVALTATLILLISPDSLMSPSFQMSFAAVTALVSGYEILHQPLMQWRCKNNSQGKKILFYLLGISLSTILATIATTPYIIYTFNRLTVHAIPANLVSIPLLSFIIIPLLVLFLFIIGFGSGQFIGYFLKLSIGVMIKIACWISTWPGSVILIPCMSPKALAFLTLGAMWIIIWKEYWRWQGLWGLGIGLMIMIFHQPPDIYINADKSLVIFHIPHQSINSNQNLIANSMRSGRFARESWMKRMAAVECVKLKDYFKKMSHDPAQRLITSTADHLMFHFKKSDIVFQEQEKSFYCDWECRLIHQKTGEILTFPNEQNQGGLLVWVTPWGFYQKTVAQEIGHRPWQLRVPNFKNLAP